MSVRPKPISLLIELWESKLLTENQKDSKTYEIILMIEKEGREDSHYYSKIENLLCLQTIINFVRDRIE